MGTIDRGWGKSERWGKIGQTEAHKPIRLKAKGVHLLGTELVFLLSHGLPLFILYEPLTQLVQKISDSDKEKRKAMKFHISRKYYNEMA